MLCMPKRQRPRSLQNPDSRDQRAQRQQRRPLTASLPVILLILALAGCTVPVTIEWATEVEIDTAGFDIYRGESPQGPFDVKVNEAPIPASPDAMAGGEYSFVDRTAQAGRTYYYQLQEVEVDGTVNTYGPIEVTAGWLSLGTAVILLGAAALAVGLVLVLGSRRTRGR